jgi:type IV pilus assembly protein PilA
MIVVAIVGVLAVLAVFSIRKYMANAKTAEARDKLGQIAKDSGVAYDRTTLASTTVYGVGTKSGLQHAMCKSASAAVPAAQAAIQGRKYQSSSADWYAGDGLTGWRCLKFAMSDPQYYMYSYSAPTVTGTSATFTATANGDLNGNGVLSTFSIAGSVSATGAINTAPTISETLADE